MHSDAQYPRTERQGDWWKRRRFAYNTALVIAGLLAFPLYCGVILEASRSGALPDADITPFTTLFQAVGYLFMMLVANLCYKLGPLCERFIRPQSIPQYRSVAFMAGVLFSVALPFSIPVLLALKYLLL
jgi:uncharacterized BrkB/YihY/UPF0761 family membrane protein